MSYITIELDTTSPTLEVHTPSYVTKYNNIEVSISANEILSQWQEIYTIDEEGTRRDYTFKIEKNNITGNINPFDYPLGLFHLYVKVKDEVDNESELYVSTITKKDSFPKVFLDINDFSQGIYLEETVREVSISEKTRNQIISSKVDKNE